jgi:hypothetical protein
MLVSFDTEAERTMTVPDIVHASVIAAVIMFHHL